MLKMGWFEKTIVYAALKRRLLCSSLLEPHFGNRTISWGERLLALRTRIAAGVPLVGDGSSSALTENSSTQTRPLPLNTLAGFDSLFRKACAFRNEQSTHCDASQAC